MDAWRYGRLAFKSRAIAVDDLALRHCYKGVGIARLSCGSLSLLGSSGPLLTRRVLFGEALLPGLGLPVVVPYTSAIEDYPAAELSEHGTRSDNGDLP